MRILRLLHSVMPGERFPAVRGKDHTRIKKASDPIEPDLNGPRGVCSVCHRPIVWDYARNAWGHSLPPMQPSVADYHAATP